MTTPVFNSKKIATYWMLIGVLVISFLFSPKPRTDDPYCGRYISLGAHAGFVFNCDAADYCMTAKYPSRILADSGVRQSRPLYIFLASTIGYPLQWLADKADLAIFHSMGEEAAGFVGFYAGYILINFLCLLCCLVLFELIVGKLSTTPVKPAMLYAFFILLVSNEVSKAFFWTAHQQFFALLTPLLTIWVALKMNEQERNQENISLHSLVCGIGMLFYGNFITMFGSLIIVAFLADKKMHFLHLLKNIVLFLLPTGLWVAFCIYHHGHYYNHEVAVFRQLVWVNDALQVSFGHFLSVFGENIQAYFSSFGEMVVFMVLAVVSVIYVAGKKEEHRKSLQAIVTTGVILVLFFMLLGFYEERLTYTLLPVCLCAIALYLSGSEQLKKRAALLPFIAIAWHIYTVLSYGPFS